MELEVIRCAILGGTWALMDGSPGSGKTTLLRWGLDAALALGRPTAILTAVELESEIPYSALGDLIASFWSAPAFQHASLLPSTVQVCDEVLAGTHIEDAQRVRMATTDLLRNCAAVGFVIAIDDAQWIDLSSGSALTFALRRTYRSVPLLVAARSGHQNLGVNALRAEPGAAQFSVGPLGGIAISSIVARELETPGVPPVLEEQPTSIPRPMLVKELAVAARGNPLRAREIGRAARAGIAAGLFGDDLTIADNPLVPFAQRLPSGHRELLYAATHLRVPTITTIEAVFGRDALTDALTTSLSTGYFAILNGRLEVDHPLMADALSAVIPPKTKEAIHSRLAVVVSDQVERSRHLAKSDAAQDYPLVEELLFGSSLASQRGAFGLALQIAHRAAEIELGLEPSGRSRPSTQRWIAHIEFAIDDNERSIARLEETLRDMVPGFERTRVQLELADVVSWSFAGTHGMDLYREIIFRPDEDPKLVAQAALQLAVLEILFRDVRAALELGQIAVHKAEPFGGQLLSEAMAIDVVARFVNGKGFDTASLDDALALERLTDRVSLQGPAFHWVPLLMSWCNDPKAFDAFDHRRAVIAAAGGTTTLATGGPFEVRMLCEWGRIDDARALVQYLNEIAEYDNDLTKALAALAQARFDVHRGDIASALPALDLAEATFGIIGFRVAQIEVASVRSEIDAQLNRHQLLSERAEIWLSSLVESGWIEPACFPDILNSIHAVTADLSDSTVSVRGCSIARELTAMLQSVATPERHDVRQVLMWAEACGGALSDPDMAAKLFDEVSQEWKAVGRLFWAGRAHFEAGRVLRRSGSRRRAGLHLDEAVGLFNAVEAHGWVVAATKELARLGRRHSADSKTLSDTETQIAMLAAAGESNRQIAQQMFVSDKTVEAHLSAVYRKLSIARRAQLHDALRQAGEEKEARDDT